MEEILLIGNPNTGKTTLFNNLTKSNEHIGNWHGVTVEEKRKKFKIDDKEFELVDLPGIYSLTALSFEEQVAVDYIFKNLDKLVINICDINNLQRNLYLTLQLLELGINTILVINTMGNKKFYNEVNLDKLQSELGIKAIIINADNKKDIENLKKLIKNQEEIDNNIKIPQYYNLFSNFDDFFKIKKVININDNMLSNFITIKVLEKDENIMKKFNISYEISDKYVNKIAKIRYDYINFISKRFITRNKHSAYGESKLDKIFLNRFLALPMFLLIMATIFYLTF